MWRPRDRERYIGSYDPEHEMPNPDRDPGDRWQSGAYRHNARDSRFAYRLDPNRFESQFEGRRDVDREMEARWDRDARDRGYGRDFAGRDFGERNREDFRQSYHREQYGGAFTAGHYGQDRGGYGGRDWDRGSYGGGYGGDRGDFDRGGYDRNFDTGPRLDRWGADRGRDHDRGGFDDRWDRENWRNRR